MKTILLTLLLSVNMTAAYASDVVIVTGNDAAKLFSNPTLKVEISKDDDSVTGVGGNVSMICNIKTKSEFEINHNTCTTGYNIDQDTFWGSTADEIASLPFLTRGEAGPNTTAYGTVRVNCNYQTRSCEISRAVE